MLERKDRRIIQIRHLYTTDIQFPGLRHRSNKSKEIITNSFASVFHILHLMQNKYYINTWSNRIWLNCSQWVSFIPPWVSQQCLCNATAWDALMMPLLIMVCKKRLWLSPIVRDILLNVLLSWRRHFLIKVLKFANTEQANGDMIENDCRRTLVYYQDNI